jgi:two-component system OmpR family sensor kinase
MTTAETTTTETTTATTTEPSSGIVRRRPIPVRLRITAAVVVLAGLALSGAGLVVYAIELQEIGEEVDQQISQELDELELLAEEGGSSNPQGLVRSYLETNVPSPSELMLGWVGGRADLVGDGSAHEEVARDPELIQAVNGLLPRGGTTDIDTAFGTASVVVKPVQADNQPDAAFVLVHFQDTERAQLSDMTQTYAVVAAAALLALTVGAWSLSGRLLRPVRELRTTAQEISDTDLTRRIPARGNDDLTDLTLTFNAMLDRLEDAFAGQREFLNDAGHELRTPITIIRGHLELVDPDDPAEVAATRTLVLDEIDRMSRLIDELILLAHSRRPDFVHLTMYDIGELTDDLAEKVRGLGDREWTVDERASGPAEVDPQRITQAVLQLAKNAVSHTDPADTIAIGSQVDPETVTLWVRDTGPGIAPDEQRHIFDRFYRGRDSRSEGSGLGLSIVRAIAEAHGGQVAVRSAPGHGATFRLTLPRRLSELAPPDSATDETTIIPLQVTP